MVVYSSGVVDVGCKWRLDGRYSKVCQRTFNARPLSESYPTRDTSRLQARREHHMENLQPHSFCLQPLTPTMAPEFNTSREALDADTKAHRVTKDELELTKRRLVNATEVKTYALTKASEQTAEMTKEIAQLKEEYERQLKELQGKHLVE